MNNDRLSAKQSPARGLPSDPIPTQFIPNQPHLNPAELKKNFSKPTRFPQSLSPPTPCWLMHPTPSQPCVQSSSLTVISLRVHCAPFSSTVHLFCVGSLLSSWSSFSSCSFWTHSIILRSSKGWDTSCLKIRCHNISDVSQPWIEKCCRSTWISVMVK